jgi:hypothetical protein
MFVRASIADEQQRVCGRQPNVARCQPMMVTGCVQRINGLTLKRVLALNKHSFCHAHTVTITLTTCHVACSLAARIVHAEHWRGAH